MSNSFDPDRIVGPDLGPKSLPRLKKRTLVNRVKEVYIMFLFSVQNIACGYMLELPL